LQSNEPAWVAQRRGLHVGPDLSLGVGLRGALLESTIPVEWSFGRISVTAMPRGGVEFRLIPFCVYLCDGSGVEAFVGGEVGVRVHLYPHYSLGVGAAAAA